MNAMWSKRRILCWGIGLTVVGFVVWFAFAAASINCTLDMRRMRMVAVEMAIEAYVADTGHLPADLSALSGAAQTPYVRADSLRDASGTMVGYEILDESARRYRLSAPATHRSNGRRLPELSEVYAVPLEQKR